METHHSKSLAGRLKPYGAIAIAAILAYLPVSSMLFSLKNDVIGIEYPIQHFISESLRKGEFPGWFNTWSMGFPLQSVLTWGVYSTPRMFTGLLFGSNIYLLQAEFVLFIIASGCCMFKLLKKHFIKDHQIALLLSCCYMLSGFTVGSSQWLLYITGMVFIPLSLYCLLSLLKAPSLKYAVLFAVSYYLLFTNTHIYLSITATYLFIFFISVYLLRLILSRDIERTRKTKLSKFILLSLVLTGLFCAAPVYYSIETILFLERSLPLEGNSTFFQSNYLHPDALGSLLFPLSAIKTSHFNTEGTVLDVYIGLLPLLLLPLSLLVNSRQQNRKAWQLLLVSLIFLFISFGHLTPLRSWLNILPGMSHFRHPGVLRIFFNLFFILYLAQSFKELRWQNLFEKKSVNRKYLLGTNILLLLLSLFALAISAGYTSTLWKGSIYETIKTIHRNELVLISAVIQVFFTGLLLFSIIKRPHWFSFILIVELVINTLACTPFFTVSAYRSGEVAAILHSTSDFPVQQNSPYDVPASFIDQKNNTWHNINTYKKEVSNNISMPGPLIIEKVSAFLSAGGRKEMLAGKQLVFLRDTLNNSAVSIHITRQLPSKVTADIDLPTPGEIILQQAAFPGWKAFYNDKEIPLLESGLPFVSVKLPAGRGKLEFKFEKKGVLYSALLLHLVVLLTMAVYGGRKIFIRSSSL
ncbi:MAG: YfhO family protein [Chitinophagaceae bacterium]